MKKIFLSMVFIFIVVMLLPAKVSYVKNEDGTYSAIITFKSSINQANIIGTFNSWQKPGVPMVKNADGIWEYKLLINAPQIKYKFFDPAISDDSAYIDDPEFEERIANPFGSFDYLIRRSKAIAATGGAGGGDGAAPIEIEEEFAPVFGMWSQIYYSFQLFTDFAGKVVYDKTGKVVYNGFLSGERKYEEITKGGKTYWDWVDTEDNAGINTSYKSSYYERYDDGSGTRSRLLVDKEIGFMGDYGHWRFLGENGTTAGDYSRIILGRDSFSISSTLKFHGKVSKNFQVDVEVNSQLFWINANERWVRDENSGSKEDRENWWSKRVMANASNFFSGLYGGVGRNYVFPKQYYNNDALGADSGMNTGGRGATFDGSDLDSGSIHIDQLQVCWTTDNFDIYVSPVGGKNFYTADPMSLVSATRIANSNYAQSSVQALIHPDAIKGLNFNLATTYTASTKQWSGGGGANSIREMVPELSEVGRYIAVADINYDILGLDKYIVGFIYDMSALGVPAYTTIENQLKDYPGLHAFGNAIHQLSLWAELKPVKGLNVKIQGAMELDTKYWDGSKSNNVNQDYYLEKASYMGYDPLAHMADYISVGYKNSFLDVSLYQAAAGSRFKGNLAEYGSMFAGYLDIWASDYLLWVNGHGDLANGAGTLGGGLNFAVNPILSKPALLKLKLGYDIRAIGVASPTFSNAYYSLIQEASATKTLGSSYDPELASYFDMSKQWTLRNAWSLGLDSNIKLNDKLEMYIRSWVEFRLDTYFGQAIIKNENGNGINSVIDASTSIFTLSDFDLRVGLNGLSNVLKAVELQYHLTFGNHEPYYKGSPILNYDPNKIEGLTDDNVHTQEEYDDYNNKWAFKAMYHVIAAEFKFANDISLSAGYLLRYSRGPVSAYSNPRYGNRPMGTDYDASIPLLDTTDGKTDYYKVPDYYSWGLAFQFKYVLPVEILKKPTLFVNLNMGWNPSSFFDPGYIETSNFDTGGTAYDNGTSADWGSHIHDFQMVNLTIGLQWDF